MYSPHEINRPAASFITRVPMPLTPPPSLARALGSGSGACPASCTPSPPTPLRAPSLTGGRILVADTETLIFSYLPGGHWEPRGLSNSPMASFQLGPAAWEGGAFDPCLPPALLLVPPGGGRIGLKEECQGPASSSPALA